MDDNKKRKEKLNYNNNQKNILVKKQEIVGKMYKGERERVWIIRNGSDNIDFNYHPFLLIEILTGNNFSVQLKSRNFILLSSIFKDLNKCCWQFHDFS